MIVKGAVAGIAEERLRIGGSTRNGDENTGVKLNHRADGRLRGRQMLLSTVYIMMNTQRGATVDRID